MLVEPLAPSRCWSGRASASATRPRATPTCCGAQDAFKAQVVPLVEVDSEIVSSTHIGGLVVAGDLEQATASSARRSSCAAPSSTATSAGASWATRPRTSSPTTRSSTRATASTPAAPRSRTDGEWRWWPAADERRRAPDLRHRPRRARRGLPARLRGRPLRPRAADRVPRAPARRAALRHDRRSWSSRCTATCRTHGDRRPEADKKTVHCPIRAFLCTDCGVSLDDLADRFRPLRPGARRELRSRSSTPATTSRRPRARKRRSPRAASGARGGADRAPLRAGRRPLAARRSEGRPGRLHAPRS